MSKLNVQKSCIHPAWVGVCMHLQPFIPSYSNRPNSRTNQGREIVAWKLVTTILTPQSMGYLIAGKRETPSLQDKNSTSKAPRA